MLWAVLVLRQQIVVVPLIACERDTHRHVLIWDQPHWNSDTRHAQVLYSILENVYFKIHVLVSVSEREVSFRWERWMIVTALLHSVFSSSFRMASGSWNDCAHSGRLYNEARLVLKAWKHLRILDVALGRWMCSRIIKRDNARIHLLEIDFCKIVK